MVLKVNDFQMDYEEKNDKEGLNEFSSEFKSKKQNHDSLDFSSEEFDMSKTESLNIVRAEALYLKGVEEMSTEDVKEYCITYCLSASPSIEWIDDSSCNLVYPDASSALSALSYICQSKIDTLYINSLVPAKMHPKYNNSKLFIRHSRISDKKAPGARERSRWYLFHPHPDEKRDMTYRYKRDVSQRFNPYKRMKKQHNTTFGSLFKKNKPVVLSMLHNSSLHLNRDSRISGNPQLLLDSSSGNNVELFPEKLSISKVDRFVQILQPSANIITSDGLSKASNKELFPEKQEDLVCKELFLEKLKETSHEKIPEKLNGTFHKELFPEKILGSQRHSGYFSSNDVSEKVPFVLSIRGSSKRKNNEIDIF
ncbi:hypothetical protein PORY_001938 [Pneumocystis oryctolagi]|uniref:Uncharacterized protein n=1 Tax=Pneumocystis oryctolagi TaxID=42067 RepID=A0ACB7CAY0_9ASCO|nr:hypothetical protein PORY_001938 [Pneumocystis oryctolagi]